ncbi:hypothetical protein MKW98_016654 [Papaver atlanticum]|uniref:Protein DETOXIFICATION n=1 Tax=Papaver atlanticum TaxID=357466 RepID=A0AAD4STZ3_9MAGN|nr:hypothetical protein MKW98_016654 [Papaver atlanticum]
MTIVVISLCNYLLCSFRKQEWQTKIIEELKKQLWLSGPLIVNNVLQFCLQLISFMFVGHLGELTLSSFSMASCFAVVTGFSVLIGWSSALDTLCGQSYGAKQNHMLGIHMQRAMLVLFLVSVPISFIWANTSSILLAFGQHPDTAAEAGIYTRFFIPSLFFAVAVLQCQFRFLQTQNIVFPVMIIFGATTLPHILVCWILVFKTSLGSKGAVIAYGPATWTGFSIDAFHDIPNFLRLAIPSAVMACLQIWSSQIIILLSSFLPNPKLETSVLSICTRVSNELGANHPQAARLATRIMLYMVILQGFLLGISMILMRHIWGYAFSNEQEVITYVAAMMPVLAKIGAFVNLGAYYLVGIPSSLLFSFVLHMGGKGLLFGLICAMLVQGSIFMIMTLYTNWEQEAKRARELVYSSSIPVDFVP